MEIDLPQRKKGSRDEEGEGARWKKEQGFYDRVPSHIRTADIVLEMYKKG